MWNRKKIATLSFSIIWIVFCILFLMIAFFSWQSVNTELHRAKDYDAPEGADMLFKGVSIIATMEDIVKTHNINVEKLEQSIQSEAKTMTAINCLSAILCILGFLAQNGFFVKNRLVIQTPV